MSNQVPEETFSNPTHQNWLAKRKAQHPLNPQPIEETQIRWLTTNANPRLAGWTEKHGWKMHAVPVSDDAAKFSDIKRVRALCGLRPRHGWGIDLFIEAKCACCQKKAGAQ